MDNEQNEYIDLEVLAVDFWKAIRKYWYGVLLITFLSVAAFWGYKQLSYIPMYRAQASFTVKMIDATAKNETSTSYNFYYDKNTANQIAETFPYIISSDTFTSRLQEYLGTAAINGSISVSVIENSNLVTLSVTSPDSEDALTVLEGVIEVYPEIVQYVIGNTKLEIIKEPEVGDQPYNRQGRRSILIRGMEIGLLLSFGLLFLYALLKKTIRQESDLKQILNVSCLAQIPEVKNSSELSLAQSGKQSSYVENIYALQNRVDYLMQKNGMKILAVTSTGPSEGKTTVSAHLAAAMARRGKKVLMIDGDLRKPDLKKRFQCEKKTVSLQEFFEGKADLKEVMVKLEDNLFYIGNEKPTGNPGVLIHSEKMKILLHTLKQTMDIIIIDTPPCGMLADASYYVEYTDAVLYVVRQDWLDKRKIIHAIEDLPEHGEKIIGSVLNRIQTGVFNYGGYGYGHYRHYDKYKSRYYKSRESYRNE